MTSRSDAPMPAALRCHRCDAVFGALLPISPAKLREMLAGTLFAGLAGALPPDVAGTIAPVLEVECGACLLLRIEDAKKKQLEGGRDAEASDVQDDQDEEGNPRQLARPRGRFFPGRRDRRSER